MNAPPVLLPYQQRWVADTSQVKVCEKSRRVGISWASAAECALVASAQKGMDCWYVGYNKDMALEFIRDTANWAKAYNLVAAEISEEVFKDGDEEILAFVVRFASGFRVTALSSRPSNLRGKQGYVVLDEAAFHEKLDELLKAALALLMWGGRVAIISTHDGVENAFNQLVLDVRAKKKPYSIHRVTLDDALAEGLYRRICLRLGKPWTEAAEQAWRQDLLDQYGDAAEEELFCIPRRSGGAYLSGTLIEDRMVDGPVLRLELDDAFAQKSDEERRAFVETWCETQLATELRALNRDLQHGFGVDFGRVSDLSVFAPFELERNLVRRFPFLVEVRNVPFREQEIILFYIVDRLPRLLGGALDATGNGAYLAERAAQRYGMGRIEQVKLSDSWYAEHLPPFKAAFEDGTIEVPRDADVKTDLRALQVIDGVPKLPKAKRRTGADGKKRHGDAAIALVLGHRASRIDVEVFDYRAVRFDRRDEDGEPFERTVRTGSGAFRSRGGLL